MAVPQDLFGFFFREFPVVLRAFVDEGMGVKANHYLGHDRVIAVFEHLAAGAGAEVELRGDIDHPAGFLGRHEPGAFHPFAEGIRHQPHEPADERNLRPLRKEHVEKERFLPVTAVKF